MKKTSLALVIVALLLSPLCALDLSIDDAVSYALKNSRTLKSAQVDLAIAEANSNVSWNGLLPTVQAQTALNRSNETISTSTYAKTRDTSSVLAAGLSFSWAFTPALITNMKLAEESYAAGKITWEETVAQTTRDVKKLFYAILLQQQTVTLQEQTLANTKDRMEQTEKLYEQGYTTELSVLQTQVSYENLKATVLKQHQAVDQQKQQFAFLLGLDGETLNLTGEISSDFKTIDEKACMDKASSSYTTDSLLQQMRILDVQKKLVDEQSYAPAFSFSASWMPTVLDISKSWKDNNTLDGGSISIAIGWNLTNMLPWSSSRQSARTIVQNKQKLAINLNTVQESNRLQVSTLLTTLREAQDAIESSERNIALAQKSYDLVQDGYAQGTQELLAVKESEQQLAQARLGKLSEQYNYLSALLDLEYALRTSF